MKLFLHLRDWLVSVLSAWYGWVGASATVGLVGFGQGMEWWSAPPKWVYVSLLIFGLSVSMFQAWRKEHCEVEEIHEKMEDLSTKYFDERPQLMLGVISCVGDKQWAEQAGSRNSPVHFYLQHLSGRPATEVHFDPIFSESGKFEIRFNPVGCVTGPVRSSMDYSVWENKMEPDPPTIESVGWGCLLRYFFYDCDWAVRLHPFEVTVRFRDRDDYRMQKFRIVFDAKEYKVLTPTEIKQP